VRKNRVFAYTNVTDYESITKKVSKMLAVYDSI